MTYVEYLQHVIHCLHVHREDTSLKGICWCSGHIHNKHRLPNLSHWRRLRDELAFYLRPSESWIDKDWEWRWKHGNVLPYCRLTRNMMVNMRVRYLESLIRKEQ